MVVLVSRTAPTSPTELIGAKAAGHMVAAGALFNASLAHGTHRHIVFVFISPTCQLLLHCFFTGGFFTVPVIFALEAKLS